MLERFFNMKNILYKISMFCLSKLFINTKYMLLINKLNQLIINFIFLKCHLMTN